MRFFNKLGGGGLRLGHDDWADHNDWEVEPVTDEATVPPFELLSIPNAMSTQRAPVQWVNQGSRDSAMANGDRIQYGAPRAMMQGHYPTPVPSQHSSANTTPPVPAKQQMTPLQPTIDLQQASWLTSAPHTSGLDLVPGPSHSTIGSHATLRAQGTRQRPANEDPELGSRDWGRPPKARGEAHTETRGSDTRNRLALPLHSCPTVPKIVSSTSKTTPRDQHISRSLPLQGQPLPCNEKPCLFTGQPPLDTLIDLDECEAEHNYKHSRLALPCANTAAHPRGPHYVCDACTFAACRHIRMTEPKLCHPKYLPICSYCCDNRSFCKPTPGPQLYGCVCNSERFCVTCKTAKLEEARWKFEAEDDYLRTLVRRGSDGALQTAAFMSYRCRCRREITAEPKMFVCVGCDGVIGA